MIKELVPFALTEGKEVGGEGKEGRDDRGRKERRDGGREEARNKLNKEHARNTWTLSENFKTLLIGIFFLKQLEYKHRAMPYTGKGKVNIVRMLITSKLIC